MSDPVRAADSHYPVDVEAGETYFCCACGRSATQPFCDGAHIDTGFTPIRYEAEESKTLYFCGCKVTGQAPFCDGSHNR